MPTATDTPTAIVVKNTNGHKYRQWVVCYSWVTTTTHWGGEDWLDVTARRSGTMEFATKTEGVTWVKEHLTKGATITGGGLRL